MKWTVERVKERYPDCGEEAAKEVAELLTWAHQRKRDDTGEKLSTQQVKQVYEIAVALAK